jgi:hypothetical protein
VTPPAPPQLLHFSYPAVTGRTLVVPPGGNLQTVLNTAQRGDEIVLPAGASFTGNFVLPAKPGTAADGWILIRSNQALPPQGTRVTAADAPRMARLVTANTQPALATAAKASGWWLSGVEVTIAPTVTAINYGLLALGNGSETVLSNVPSDLVIERSIVRGQPTSSVSRCIALNSARTAIQRLVRARVPPQGLRFAGHPRMERPRPVQDREQHAGGGGREHHVRRRRPQDRGADPERHRDPAQLHRHADREWKGVWTKKNIFELKSAQRVLLEGNVLDGSWSDGQTGFAVVLKVANQSGSCTWCTTPT